jgi:hypothetical protein
LMPHRQLLSQHLSEICRHFTPTELMAPRQLLSQHQSEIWHHLNLENKISSY